MMDIKRILKDHEIWLIGNGQGKRANLRGEDLRGADLRGAYLYSIVGKTIYTLNSIKHPAFYIKEDDIINIGCKSLTYTDWVNCGENIGVSEGYSPEEVVIYLNWMKAIKAL
jgi:hypothetical protein